MQHYFVRYHAADLVLATSAVIIYLPNRPNVVPLFRRQFCSYGTREKYFGGQTLLSPSHQSILDSSELQVSAAVYVTITYSDIVCRFHHLQLNAENSLVFQQEAERNENVVSFQKCMRGRVACSMPGETLAAISPLTKNACR